MYRAIVDERIDHRVERQHRHSKRNIPSSCINDLEVVQTTDHNERNPAEKICSDENGDLSLECFVLGLKATILFSCPGGLTRFYAYKDVHHRYNHEAQKVDQQH